MNGGLLLVLVPCFIGLKRIQKSRTIEQGKTHLLALSYRQLAENSRLKNCQFSASIECCPLREIGKAFQNIKNCAKNADA